MQLANTKCWDTYSNWGREARRGSVSGSNGSVRWEWKPISSWKRRGLDGLLWTPKKPSSPCRSLLHQARTVYNNSHRRGNCICHTADIQPLCFRDSLSLGTAFQCRLFFRIKSAVKQHVGKEEIELLRRKIEKFLLQHILTQPLFKFRLKKVPLAPDMLLISLPL